VSGRNRNGIKEYITEVFLRTFSLKVSINADGSLTVHP